MRNLLPFKQSTSYTDVLNSLHQRVIRFVSRSLKRKWSAVVARRYVWPLGACGTDCWKTEFPSFHTNITFVVFIQYFVLQLPQNAERIKFLLFSILQFFSSHSVFYWDLTLLRCLNEHSRQSKYLRDMYVCSIDTPRNFRKDISENRILGNMNIWKNHVFCCFLFRETTFDLKYFLPEWKLNETWVRNSGRI